MEVKRHMKNNRNAVEFVEDSAAKTVTITISGYAYKHLEALANALWLESSVMKSLGYAVPENGVSKAFAAELISGNLIQLQDAEGFGEVVRNLVDGNLDDAARLLAYAAAWATNR